MKECTKTQNRCPPQARLCEPSQKDRRENAGSHETRVHHGRLIIAVSQLDGAEKDHVANNPKKGKPLEQLHKQYADDRLQLLTCLAGLGDHPTGMWRCKDPLREVAITLIKCNYRRHASSRDLLVEVMQMQISVSITSDRD